MESCRDDVLFDVDLIEKIRTPGKIIVFGDNAEPILTGQNEEDIIMAAAELGRGRIFSFSHHSYGKQVADPEGSYKNSTLYRNVRNWVANKKLSDDVKILRLDETRPSFPMKELQAYDIVVCLGGRETISSKLLEEYIRQGGAFIHATTPWVWLQQNPTKHLSELPYGKLLNKAGFSYSKEYAKNDREEFVPKLNKAADGHIKRCLFWNEENPEGLIDKIALLSGINELTPEIAGTFKPSIDKHWKSVDAKITKLCHSTKLQSKNLNEKNLLDFWLLGANLQQIKNFKAPGIKYFPGDFNKLPQLLSKTVQFASIREDFHFTACYAPAAVCVTMEVTNISKAWTVIVGAHMDRLGGPKVNRWPRLCHTITINALGNHDLSSPFGGGIYLLSPKNTKSNIEFTVHNIVHSPTFDLINKGKSWKESRNDPGLWADLSGRYISITVPSSCIRTFEDPTDVLKLYDDLLLAYHDLRGTDINQERRMWIVADEQPSAGYMHSGYPIVTHLDVVDPKNAKFLLNATNLKKYGFWGLFHEIGHNMQQHEWTFHGTGEVTVNIFTLYGMKTICGIKAWIHPWLQEQTASALKYLKSGADFNTWRKEPELALYFYAQLINAFTFETYKKVFRRYQALTPHEKPRDDQRKIDMWFIIFSQKSKHNLAPIATFWGMPLSGHALKKLTSLKLTEFLPNDEITKEAPDRVKLAKEKFPNLVFKPV